MARKKPQQYVPLEERPHFLALVEGLVNVPAEQFPAIARQCVAKYHDAVLAGHVEELDQLEAAYTALVYKLNGGTLFGCCANPDSPGHVLAREVAAQPGQVPTWGQAGEFLLEVEGMRVRVVFKSNMLRNQHDCALHAVDWDRPFLSTTGYRAAGLAAAACLGESVEQAARRLVLDMLHGEGKPKPIVIEPHSKARSEDRPQWLADALAGVRADGQLAMFGDAPKDPTKKAPLSNAERQRLHRARERERKAALKAEGLHTLELSSTDLARLFLALDTHVSFDPLLDWDQQAYRELATRLFKGEAHGAAMVQALGTSEGVAVLQKQRDKDAKRGWDSYHDERKRSRGLVERCNAQACELAAARAEVERLQAALQQIAAEVGAAPGVPPAPLAKVDCTEALQRRVAALEGQHALEVADRAKAFEAVAVLQARLQKAGLVHDYRRQPGE